MKFRIYLGQNILVMSVTLEKAMEFFRDFRKGLVFDKGDDPMTWDAYLSAKDPKTGNKFRLPLGVFAGQNPEKVSKDLFLLLNMRPIEWK